MSDERASSKTANHIARTETGNRLMWLVIMCFVLFGVRDVMAGISETSSRYLANTAQNVITGQLEQTGYRNEYVNRQFKFAVQAFQQEEHVLAFRVFSSVAEIGHTESQYYTGMQYDMGVGVQHDMHAANFWYTQAALKGDDRAQHNLAVAYAKGEGVKSDILMALSLWLQSAKQGNTDSAYNLGILYATGHDGVAPNPVKAMKWWHKAAMNGDGYAQFNLGTMFANGDVGVKNYCEAIRWWKLSVTNGVAEAGVAIEVVKQRQDYHSCLQGK